MSRATIWQLEMDSWRLSPTASKEHLRRLRTFRKMSLGPRPHARNTAHARRHYVRGGRALAFSRHEMVGFGGMDNVRFRGMVVPATGWL